jgi:hypothetical protein
MEIKFWQLVQLKQLVIIMKQAPELFQLLLLMNLTSILKLIDK